MTVRILFGENSSNQFYIRLCVQIFNIFVCLLLKKLFDHRELVVGTSGTVPVHTQTLGSGENGFLRIEGSDTLNIIVNKKPELLIQLNSFAE